MPILHMALQKCQSSALLLCLIVRHYEGLYFKMAEMWKKKTHIDRILQTSFHLAKNHSQPMVYLHRQKLYIWLYAQEYPRYLTKDEGLTYVSLITGNTVSLSAVVLRW